MVVPQISKAFSVNTKFSKAQSINHPSDLQTLKQMSSDQLKPKHHFIDMVFLYADPVVRETILKNLVAVDTPLDLQIEY